MAKPSPKPSKSKPSKKPAAGKTKSSGKPAAKPAKRAKAAPPPPIVTLARAALGQRVESPQVGALLGSVRLGPLPGSTPNAAVAHVQDETLGLELGATFFLRTRAHFPPKREGPRWANWLSLVTFTEAWKGALPDELSFTLKEKALPALGFVQVPRGRGVVWAKKLDGGLVLHADWRDEKRVSLRVDEELDFITRFPLGTGLRDGRHLVGVEDAFLAAWAGLSGVLRADRLSNDALTSLRDRRVSPLGFLEGPLGGVLWSGDLEPTKVDFFQKYYRGVGAAEDFRFAKDAAAVFGKLNQHRAQADALTSDTWAAYDALAPKLTQRLAEWNRARL